MPADALATLGARASIGMVLTPPTPKPEYSVSGIRRVRRGCDNLTINQHRFRYHSSVKQSAIYPFGKKVINFDLLRNIKGQICWWWYRTPLLWRHNGRDGVSSHQPRDCLLNRLFRRKIKENIKAPRHWPLCGEFTGDRWIPCTNGQ